MYQKNKYLPTTLKLSYRENVYKTKEQLLLQSQNDRQLHTYYDLLLTYCIPTKIMTKRNCLSPQYLEKLENDILLPKLF